VLEACLHFFRKTIQAFSIRFAEQCSHEVQSDAPELLNPDGKASCLLPLQDSYQECLEFSIQFKIEPELNFCIRILVDSELHQSFVQLLLDCAPESSGVSSARQRDTNSRDQEEVTMANSEFGSRSSIPPPVANSAGNSSKWNIDLLLDVELPIAVSFGETEMQLKDVLKLGVGSVIELNKSVNDPVTLIVNKKPIARGEVVMVEGNYGVRILEVESTAERIRSLG
jgi:flagellar motor switch protein FliN